MQTPLTTEASERHSNALDGACQLCCDLLYLGGNTGLVASRRRQTGTAVGKLGNVHEESLGDGERSQDRRKVGHKLDSQNQGRSTINETNASKCLV
jgi:hypothetical protein